MVWCKQVFVYLSAASYVSEGVETSESFLNFRARSDGIHSQSARLPPTNDAHLSHVKAKLHKMRDHDFSDIKATLDSKVKGFITTGSECEADIFLEGWRRPYGFGSRALIGANEVQLAAVFGLSITVCGGDFVQETWAKHFKNEVGISVCEEEMCRADEQSISQAALLGMRMSKDLSSVDPESLVNLKHTIFRRMYSYKDDTMAAVNATLESVPLDVQTSYVGIHIRRGDKEKEAEPTPMSSYATAALEQMDIYGTRTVFVSSDDPSAGSMLANEFAERGHPDVQVLQQHHKETPPEVYGMRHYSDDDSTMEMLADIEGLRLATVFIGTQSSSLGRMVLYLRGELSSSISLDGGWFDSDLV